MARKHVTHRRVQLPVTTYFPPPGQLELWLHSANDPVLADLAERSTKATVSAWRWPQADSAANSSQNVTGCVSRRSQIRSTPIRCFSRLLKDDGSRNQNISLCAPKMGAAGSCFGSAS